MHIYSPNATMKLLLKRFPFSSRSFNTLSMSSAEMDASTRVRARVCILFLDSLTHN
jgi:hypothetical protein